MNFYTNIEQIGNRIFHRYIDNEGKSKSEIVKEFPIQLFVKKNPQNKTEAKTVSLMGDSLIPVDFNDIYEAKEFVKEYQDTQEIFGQTQFLYQFIANKYKETITFDFSKIKILVIDIETAYDETGFPTPDKAQQPILVIGCKVLGEKNPFVVFGTKPNTTDNYYSYIQCKDEVHLLQSFQLFWRETNPDIVTGWNCIPITESVWLKDRIVTMKDISYGDALFDSIVHHVFPKSYKPVTSIRLKNGHKVFSSKEHRFPIYKFPKDKFIDPKNDYFIQDDVSVEGISELLKENWVYLRQELPYNQRTPLTYRHLIQDNINLLLEKGFNFIVRDNEIVRKMTAMTNVSCWDNIKMEDWSVEKVSKTLSMKEVIRYLERSSKLTVYSPFINKSAFVLNLDEEIPLDSLWLSGMWYTDGTQSYKTEVSVCNKEETLASKVNEILNQYRRVPNSNLKRHKDGCFHIGTGLSRVWFWKLFIYEHVKSCSKKKIDVTLISQMSNKQFSAFMGGCIDGDGWVNDAGLISLCNYNDDIKHFSELLNWNGTFTTIFEGEKRVTFYDANIGNFIRHPKKRWVVSNFEKRIRNSKSDNLSWIINEDHALVRIEQIDTDSKIVPMLDISTDTRYFITKGIKSHNCEGFDIPYIINRSNRVMGEDFTKKFSPFHKSVDKCITSYEIKAQKINSYDIVGISIIDYLPLYKKYSTATLESYRLDVVARHELGIGKVDYSEYNGLMGLYEKNFELFCYYNYMDCKIIEDLENKLNFIFLLATVSYLGKSKYSDSLGVVRWWDVYIYHELLKKNIQIPPAKKSSSDTSIVGAFVKDPVPKLYSWIVTLDLASLYPSIIMSFNLSPEKAYKPAIYDLNKIDNFIDMKEDLSWIKEVNVTMLANGATFKRDSQGILPELVAGMFASRKAFKNEANKIAKELEEVENEIAKLEKRGVK